MDTLSKIAGLDHIGIPSIDIDKTIEFYHGIGFTTKMRCLNGCEQVAFLQLGNLVIETYQPEETVKKNGAINHIAIAVDNIHELYEEMKEKGYEIEGNGIEYLPFWERGINFFKVIGPNKELLEFIETL